MAREHDLLEEFGTQLAELEQRRRWTEQLRAWTPAQRITALYDGRMNLQQFLEWRELAPAEIPPREERRREWSRRLWAMTPAQRVEAMNHDRLTLGQLAEWSRRRPDEVPKVGGEFAWLVRDTADWTETLEFEDHRLVILPLRRYLRSARRRIFAAR